MKLQHLIYSAAAAGMISGCAGTDALSTAEENATYSAAVTQGGDPLTGIPGDSAAPGPRDEGSDEALHRDCSVDAVHDRLVARYDTDGDGELSDTERAALEANFDGRAHGCGARPGMGMGMGHGGMPGGHHGPRPDGANTGTTSAGHPDGCGHRGHGPLPFRRLFWVYDADESGDLSDAEREAMRADLDARGANLEARMLASFDADGDGQLSDAELEAARAAHEAEREARRAGDLASYDADGDGRLGHEERRAAHEGRRAALEARFDVNVDGVLDATEKTALREYMRTVIRGEVEPQ
ncbi:MAG: hypothetical protein HYV07_17160 [Deltaproteobacteria bacterium]|nr:hypothetical protein [Deltaproteobacteria bacterium]